MMERRKLVQLWKDRPVVALATLMRVEGSSYRVPGARLLIAADGSYAGSISGGCLEAEIVRKAQWLVRSGPLLQRYSTLFDDTAEIPYGLGCGGTVDVLIEPVNTPECHALLDAMDRSLSGSSLTVDTFVNPGEGNVSRTIVDALGTVRYSSANQITQGSETLHLAEALQPPQRLLLFGAGDDARPVVCLAALMGWSVTVLDGRSQWARPERFPEADRVVCTDNASELCITSSDVVVLMTHSYEQDREWLRQVLPRGPRYLGLLGSRHRSALLVAEAAETLGMALASACENLFSPVGLDLGGDGPEAIALSITAEIQASVQGKLGASRRMTPEMVRSQIERGGASRYLQAQCAL